MQLDSKKHKILIVGLGLLGGSYAMALKKQGFEVCAITRSQSSIDYALKNGLIDAGAAFVDETLIKRCNVVVFALYPHVFIEWIEKNACLFNPGTIVTDVTGVKGAIVKKVQALMPAGVEFIAAHPMAGKEVAGVENSDDKIFCHANYIVVPTENNSSDAIELCLDLGKVLGFERVSTLSPEEHDEMIAFVSQLTHCIAVSLMCSSDNDDLVKYTGDSFRDLTRIGKINETLWSELFLLNKDALLKEMSVFEEQFARLKKAIQDGDETQMKQMMITSTTQRKKFDKPTK